MRNLDPNSGLRQISTGKLYIPRRIVLELIKNKTLTVNDLGYLLIALISADWNEGEYRYGFIRQETKKLAKMWGMSDNTLGDGFKRLLTKGVLSKKLKTYLVNNFEYYEKAHAYKNASLSDEDLKEIFGNSLLETEIKNNNNEIPDSNLSKTSKLLNVSHKIVINKDIEDKAISYKTLDDYQAIYLEGGYTSLLPEDMGWLDKHITADGRTLL